MLNIKMCDSRCILTIFFFLVIGIVKISRTRNPDFVVVCRTQRFAFSILEKRKHPSRIFHCVYIWCRMNMNNSVLRLWKPDVFALTNTWLKMLEKINFIFVWDSIRSMLSVSTKCYRVLELIGMWHKIIKLISFCRSIRSLKIHVILIPSLHGSICN